MNCRYCHRQMRRTWYGWRCFGCGFKLPYNEARVQIQDEAARVRDEIARRLIKEALGD